MVKKTDTINEFVKQRNKSKILFTPSPLESPAQWFLSLVLSLSLNISLSLDDICELHPEITNKLTKNKLTNNNLFLLIIKYNTCINIY